MRLKEVDLVAVERVTILCDYCGSNSGLIEPCCVCERDICHNHKFNIWDRYGERYYLVGRETHGRPICPWCTKLKLERIFEKRGWNTERPANFVPESKVEIEIKE